MHRFVLAAKVPGDLTEAGVRRGGASISIRGVLKARADDRLVCVYDASKGLPPEAGPLCSRRHEEQGLAQARRLDGDMYSSTMDALTHLYPRLSHGGYIVTDDYSIDSHRQALHDQRDGHGVHEPIHTIDWAGAWWQRAAP